MGTSSKNEMPSTPEVSNFESLPPTPPEANVEPSTLPPLPPSVPPLDSSATTAMKKEASLQSKQSTEILPNASDAPQLVEKKNDKSDKLAEICIDVPIAPKNIKEYGYDLVMVFPRRINGEKRHPEKYSIVAFSNLMMGIRSSKVNGECIQDKLRTILRSNRCFLDDNGKEMQTQSAKRRKSADKEPNDLERQKDMLHVEYETFTGSRENTTSAQFCELVATAISRRLQVACGLSTKMFRSIDNDEIILTIKADEMDLRVEADRTDYYLQTSNQPFAPIHKEKNDNIKKAIGDKAFQESVEHLRTVRGCPKNSEVPEMDPLLVSEGKQYQPNLREKIDLWGHNEECDGDFELKNFVPEKKSTWQELKSSLEYIASDRYTYFAPYAAYKIEDKFQPYYRRYPSDWNGNKEEELFKQVDRIRLSSTIIARHLGVDALAEGGYLVGDMFALHDEEAVDYFYKNWAMNFRMMTQPIAKVREYFGEKIALYFAWLEFYTKMLVIPAITGSVIYVIYKYDNEKGESGWLLIGFSGFVVVWSALFTELWKRKNELYNTIWGVTGEEIAMPRAQFVGETRFNPVSDIVEMWHSSAKERNRKICTSILVIFFMICIVLVALGGLFLVKKEYKNAKVFGVIPAPMCVSALNAAQIIILNMVYKIIAVKLNDWENHRTDQEYENFLITKVFLFQFCNSFASFFYIAFFKSRKDCVKRNCFKELESQLAILFIIRIVIGNTMEVLVPYLKIRAKMAIDQRGMKESEDVSQDGGGYGDIAEAQSKLNPYEQKESFEDYNEMVIQYGFVTLFVVAFPLTPLLALANNILEVHVDSFKLCVGHRRPFPQVSNSIGSWFFFLRVMSNISIITNCALLLFTSDLFAKIETPQTKWLIFIFAEHACIVLKKGVENFIRDIPLELELLNERYGHIENMVFKGLFADDNDGLVEKAEDVDLTIHDNPSWKKPKGGA